MDREPDPRLRPEYAQGELVAVTTVPHVSEAEMLRDMLLAEGIPSMVRPARSSGLTPVALGTGTHEVLVRESAYAAAYELVHGEPPPVPSPVLRARPERGNLLAIVLTGVGLIAFLIWLSGNV